jgi:hypothetical protein
VHVAPHVLLPPIPPHPAPTGYPSELCLPCPPGGICPGLTRISPSAAWKAAYAVPLPTAPAYAAYSGNPPPSYYPLTNVDIRGAGVHMYPLPNVSYYNLNGSQVRRGAATYF